MPALFSVSLVRDATDDRYPFLDEDISKARQERGRWTVRRYRGCFLDGIHIEVGRHFAFLDNDGDHWDYCEINDAKPSATEDPWRDEADEDNDEDWAAARARWLEFPEENRAWFEIWEAVPYENIIDIDEKGDECFEHPQIFTTPFDPTYGPFRPYYRARLKTVPPFGAREVWSPESTNRLTLFTTKKIASS